MGYGDMLLVGDEDVFGAEVNAASKLGEDTAKSGEILVTNQFREGLTSADGLEFEKLEVVPPGAAAAYKVGYRLS
jgi:class 3 adenylate cyclase